MERLFDAGRGWYGSRVTLTNLLPAAERPAYTVREAARYARTAPSTARTWLFGRSYGTLSGTKRSAPVAESKGEPFLTFHDLVEVAAIAAAKNAGVSLPRIRAAIDYAKSYFQVERPLLLERFLTDGRSLWLSEEALQINASESGQIAFAHISDVLRHLDYESEQPIRWWPAGRDGSILVDPRLSFGYPIITPQGVRTDEVIDRFQAGENIEDIAEEYAVTQAAIQEAIRFENRTALIPA